MFFDQLDERNAMVQSNHAFEELVGNRPGQFQQGQYIRNDVSSSRLQMG